MNRPVPRTNEEIMHAYYYEKILQRLDRLIGMEESKIAERNKNTSDGSRVGPGESVRNPKASKTSRSLPSK